ncbi:hypothetical protein BDV24DRAFT_163680 [Aspergillus arachidicola]|uniref:Uncharacterized protein n=1 Tax=Aspergillus arachidicola TaxID=656916 RepID=A0A5N6Y6Y8_9EURO|nr:hypothetical protein BDV24DRAFT_163680 [Aspergillus arachidicola]
MLRDRGLDDVSLIAAGGIVDGRGVSAAIMLGAAGVVMGTRFLMLRMMGKLPYEHVKRGMSMSDKRIQLSRDLQGARGRELDLKEIVTVWAGTGVGMVKKSERAADIVEQVQSEAQRRLRDASS